jgi:alkylation response protein AidB-like acyl-CoA dehydrogenase
MLQTGMLQTGMLQTGVASSSRGEFSPDELKTAIRSLLPRIRARAAECERARSVPAETVAELRELGFYKLVQPSGYGGYEQDFAILADLMMELAGACASTAWVCGAHQWMVGTSCAGATRCLAHQPRRDVLRLLRSRE